MELTISQAAQHIGISGKTVRARLAQGTLQGHKQSSPGGFRWIIELPTQGTLEGAQGNPGAAQATLELPEHGLLASIIEGLRSELEAKNQQISELHVLLQQTAALTAPKADRRWWKWWQ